MSELDLGRKLLLFFWAFGLAGIEIEIEGGYGWAERLPTWFRKRGAVGRTQASLKRVPSRVPVSCHCGPLFAGGIGSTLYLLPVR